MRDDCKSGGGLRRHEKAEGCEKSITTKCVADHGSESNACTSRKMHVEVPGEEHLERRQEGLYEFTPS